MACWVRRWSMTRSRPTEPIPCLSRRCLEWQVVVGRHRRCWSVSGFLAICGVPRAEIAKWALKQADRQRLTDLIRAARGLPAGERASGDQNGP